MFEVEKEPIEFSARLKRGAVVLSIVTIVSLSTIVPVKSYIARWRLMQVARDISQKINFYKNYAISKNQPIEVSLLNDQTLSFSALDSCEGLSSRKVLEEISIDLEKYQGFYFNKEVEKDKLGDQALVNRICFDPLLGSSLTREGITQGAIGISVKREKNAHEEILSSFISVYGVTAAVEFD